MIKNFLIPFLLLMVASGCQRHQPLGEVEGVVKLNGRPLGNVFVQFLPDPERNNHGPRSTATTDSDGRYRLQCDDERGGAVIGWHRVILEDMQVEQTPQGQPPRPDASRVPNRYSLAAGTPLRFEIKPGGQTIDLTLE